MSEQPVVLPISTAKELIDFARAINKLHNEQQRDLVVTLAGDIDLTGVEWTPIGNEDIPFYGTFDGAGHTISGLHIDKTEGVCCGLFGVCAGTIENLTVTGTIYNRSGEPHSAVGGIVGDLAGGVIRNCSADLVIDSNRRSLGFFAGGIVGLLEKGGLVQNCRSSVRVDNVLANFLYLGGVAGAVMDSSVERCTYTGAITVLGGEIYYIDVGGIAGNVQGRSSVTGCLHLGVLDASAYDFNCACTGGVIGRVEGPAVVRDCCNWGSVSGGERAVGGILGDFSLYDRVAEADCVVNNCLNLGKVVQSPDSCSASCGGIVGEIINKAVDRPVQVRNCVSLGELNCLGKDGPAHPIAAYAEGAVFEHNYFDQRLSVQGEGVPQEQVAQGCTARPSMELLAELPERDNRYIIGSDGALTVKNLEMGAVARKEEL